MGVSIQMEQVWWKWDRIAFRQSRRWRCCRCFLYQSEGTDVRISFSSVEKCPHLASNSFWLLSNGSLKQHNRSNRNFAKFIFQLDFFSPCYDCRIVICDHSCLPLHSNKYEGCATEHTHSDCKWLWIAWWWSWWSSSRHLRSMTVTHAAQLQSCFAQLNTCKFWFGLAGRAQNHVEQMHSSAEQVCACAARLWLAARKSKLVLREFELANSRLHLPKVSWTQENCNFWSNKKKSSAAQVCTCAEWLQLAARKSKLVLRKSKLVLRDFELANSGLDSLQVS